MVIMTATKMLSYANRRMQPGDDFEIKSPRDMKVLLASRKAKIKREEGDVPAPPPETVKKIVEVTGANPPPPNVTSTDTKEVPPKVEATNSPPSVELPPPDVVEDELAAARMEYEAKMGRRPYHGWDVAALREKMEQASS